MDDYDNSDNVSDNVSDNSILSALRDAMMRGLPLEDFSDIDACGIIMNIMTDYSTGMRDSDYKSAVEGLARIRKTLTDIEQERMEHKAELAEHRSKIDMLSMIVDIHRDRSVLVDQRERNLVHMEIAVALCTVIFSMYFTMRVDPLNSVIFYSYILIFLVLALMCEFRFRVWSDS
jgi:hypothetical protein